MNSDWALGLRRGRRPVGRLFRWCGPDTKQLEAGCRHRCWQGVCSGGRPREAGYSYNLWPAGQFHTPCLAPVSGATVLSRLLL